MQKQAACRDSSGGSCEQVIDRVGPGRRRRNRRSFVRVGLVLRAIVRTSDFGRRPPAACSGSGWRRTADDAGLLAPCAARVATAERLARAIVLAFEASDEGGVPLSADPADLGDRGRAPRVRRDRRRSQVAGVRRRAAPRARSALARLLRLQERFPPARSSESLMSRAIRARCTLSRNPKGGPALSSVRRCPPSKRRAAGPSRARPP